MSKDKKQGGNMYLLLAEEDRDLIHSLKRYLEHSGFEIDCAYDGIQALNYLKTEKYDLAIIDTKLPRMSGSKVIESISASSVELPVLAITNMLELNDDILSLKIKIADYLNKPFFIKDFKHTLDSVISNLSSDDFDIGKVSISPSKFKMTNLNSSVYITSREIDCLRFLINTGNSYTSINELTNVISKSDTITDSGIYVKSINNKLKDINSNFHIGDFEKKGYKVVYNYD